MQRKHAPIEQLRQAKKEADKYLAQKRLILPADNSAVSNLMFTKDAPILPGIPSYIPYPWTIEASKRVLFNLLREWEKKVEGAQQEDVVSFFRFCTKFLDEEKEKIQKTIVETVKLNKYDLSTLHNKESIQGIRKLLIDSFAVAVVAKSNHNVTDYIEWFINWTERLHRVWQKRTTIKK